MIIDTLILARWLLPIAPHNVVLEHYAVGIHDGKIIDVLPIDDAKQKYQANTILDRSSHAIMPGLVNTHCHNMMVLLRGLADDLPLMDWLNNHIWPAEKALISPQCIKDGTRLAIAEMIRGGTTCYNDHYFFPLESAEVTIEEGMRGCIGLHMMTVQNAYYENEEDAYQKALAILKQQSPDPLISWAMAPHAPYTTTDHGLMQIKQLSNDYNARIHLHLHESIPELDMGVNEYGHRPLQRLEHLGLLNDRLLAVHMVHLNDTEIALCSERNIHIVHCPESNLKLASGIPNIKKYLDAGINVALGTDGAASNNDLDMFGEMRTASFIAKGISGDPTALSAPEALKMATLNGAKAMGLDHKIGSLEVGKDADIIAINMDHLFTQPIYNPMSHLVYALNRLQVSDVWIAGKQLLDQGEFTRLDLEKTLAHANEWAKRALLS